MQNSLFRKYLALISTIIICSFTGIGALLIVLTSQNWINSKYNMMHDTATAVSLYLVNIDFSNFDATTQQSDMKSNIDRIAIPTNTNIIVASSSGQLYVYSKPQSQIELVKSSVLPSDVYSIFTKSNKNDGDLNGLYKQQMYSYSQSFTYKNNAGVLSNGGIIIVSVEASGINAYELSIFGMFGLSALVVLILAFFLTYIVTANMTRPLRDMAKAARRLSKGDFSTTISVPRSRQDEIGQLAIAFKDMSKSLSILEQVRRNFVANVSHELKTPMTSISGFIDGMLDGTIPTDSQEKYLNIVSQETKRLSRLVASMLSLAKLESGELVLKPMKVEITSILFKIIISFEAKLEEKNISVEGLDDVLPMYIWVDYDLFYQVLYNLVDNAIKFTPDDGYIKFALTCEKDNIIIEIKNSGEGIETGQLPQIFDRFYKTDESRSKDKTGLGLGLFIVKTVIDLHGGEITAQSVVHEYTRIIVNLPIHQTNIDEKDEHNAT